MKPFRRTTYRVALGLKRPAVFPYYDQFRRDDYLELEVLQRRQGVQLQNLMEHCTATVPYIQELFGQLSLTSSDFQDVSDLEQLPILTKDTIKGQPERFFSTISDLKYIQGSTGGSTGVPLKYRMSTACYERGKALFLRGGAMAAYEPGDTMAVIAGSSLHSNSQSVKGRVQDYLQSIRHYSSYGMDEEDLARYANHLRRWKPKYLRGYASALYVLAKYCETAFQQGPICFKGIFSTSEVLPPAQREVIESVFRSEVFDQYGLNDGGVSAFECADHQGMHIDYERAILEVVDEQGNQVYDTPGRILATSLYNYSMPFIRYDTGDIGTLASTPCSCGRSRPLLTNLLGRKTDILKLNGKIIGSPVITVLMGKVNVEQYQVIQKNESEVLILYVPGEDFCESEKEFIAQSITQHTGDLRINFQPVLPSFFAGENKHKFIINEYIHPHY